MKIAVAGNITQARIDGINRVNAKAADLVAVHIPKGLEIVHALKREQMTKGAGAMVKDQAKRRGLTNAKALAELRVEAHDCDAALAIIDNAREHAIMEINKAARVADIDAIIEGLTNG